MLIKASIEHYTKTIGDIKSQNWYNSCLNYLCNVEKCRKCQNNIECKPSGACWCMNYAKIPIAGVSDKCLCGSCLEASFADTVNHTDMDIRAEMMKSISDSFSTDNLQEHVDYVINGDGLLQFTKWYLIKRGYCCGNGCYNCPY